MCLAVAAFAVLCMLVLRAAAYLPEPDDYAYRASLVAMADGHFFTLTGAQAHALAERLAPASPTAASSSRPRPRLLNEVR